MWVGGWFSGVDWGSMNNWGSTKNSGEGDGVLVGDIYSWEKEVYFVEARRDRIHSDIDLVGVAFVECFVNWNKRWEMLVVMEKYFGRMKVACTVVGWWESFVEQLILLFFSIFVWNDSNR